MAEHISLSVLAISSAGPSSCPADRFISSIVTGLYFFFFFLYPFYKMGPAANSDGLDRSVQFKCPQPNQKKGQSLHCKGKKVKKKDFASRTFYSRKRHLVVAPPPPPPLPLPPTYHHVHNYTGNDVSSNSAVPAGEEQQCLPSGGVIYHGKYVRGG